MIITLLPGCSGKRLDGEHLAPQEVEGPRGTPWSLCGMAGVDVTFVVLAPCGDRQRWAGAAEALSAGIFEINATAAVRGAVSSLHESATDGGMTYFLVPDSSTATTGELCPDVPPGGCPMPRNAVANLADVQGRTDISCIISKVLPQPYPHWSESSLDPLPMCLLTEPFRRPDADSPISTDMFGQANRLRAFVAISYIADCSSIDSFDDSCGGTRGIAGAECTYYVFCPDDLLSCGGNEGMWSAFRETLTERPTFFATFVGTDAEGVTDGMPYGSTGWDEICVGPSGFGATFAPRLTAMASELPEDFSYRASYCAADVSRHFSEIGRRLGRFTLPCP